MTQVYSFYKKRYGIRVNIVIYYYQLMYNREECL